MDRVIVFGGSGFLGSHVADCLTDSGYEVVIFDLTPSPYLRPEQKMIVGNILDEETVNEAVRNCQIVYNFAGIADIYEASQRPIDSVKSNILGNTIILDASVKAGVKRFVFASTLYVYGKSGSFYRSTKQSCELLIENYNEVHNLPYTVLRYGSLYGPRSDINNFIYKIIKQAFEEGKITREGDGEELREYIHIYDAAKNSVSILSDEFINEHVIITGDRQMRVRDFLSMIKEMFNYKIDVEYVPVSSTLKGLHYEITPYCFSPKMAKKLISRTYIDLGQGIFEYIQMFNRER